MPKVVPSQVVALIDHLFPDIKTKRKFPVYSGNAAMLSAIVKLSAEIPTELLTISGENYSDLVHGLASLENVVNKWNLRGGDDPPNNIRDISPVTLVRDMLSKCPDEYPSASTVELTFITDANLRDSIRMDLSTAASTLHNGEWKASTVLSGAVIEALLLWKIQEKPDRVFTSKTAPKKNPEKWILEELIKVAAELGFIEMQTSEQAGHAINFRNLIHPGKAQRASQVCDWGTAHSALGAVASTIRDLERP